MKKGIETLKSYFETGDIPTQAHFEDLIDSLRHLDDGQTITNVNTDAEGIVSITLSDGNVITITPPGGGNYVSADGDTMNGNLLMTNQEVRWEENTDYAAVGFKNTMDGDNNSYMYFKTGDNDNEHFKWLHQPTGAAEAEWMSLKKKELDVKGSIKADDTTIYGNGKELIRFSDNSNGWLRLNEQQHFAGVYCGTGRLRVDGLFEVGNLGSSLKVETDGQVSVGKDVKLKGNGGGVSFLNNDGFKVYGSSASDATHGGRVNGETGSYNNLYFKVEGNLNNGFVFRTGSNNVAGITGRGDARFEGSVYAYGNVTAFSDGRLKADQQPMQDSVLDKVDMLKPTFYRWKDENKDQSPQLGFIAQEVQEQFPEWVHENGDHLSMSYDKMGAVLAVKGLQELRAEVKELKAELKALKDGITK